MEDGLLSVKVFGDLGTRLKCCVESSSDDEDSSSSGSDEEGTDSDDESVEQGHVDLVPGPVCCHSHSPSCAT